MAATSFKVSDVEVIGFDASSNFTTDSIRLGGVSSKWSIKFENNTSGGSPTYTLEYSMDNSNFHELARVIDFPIDKGILKSFQGIPFMRIVYTANGATGTVDLNYYSSYSAVSNLGR